MTAARMSAALAVETAKARAARTPRAVAAALVLGVAALCAVGIMAVASGDTALIAKLGPTASQPGWSGLLSTATQVTAAAGLLAQGVMLSWLVGREFTDRTVGALFAQPVTRTTVVAAKLVVFLAVSTLTAAALVVAVTTVALVTGQGLPGTAEVAGLGRLVVLVICSVLLATPCAWAATAGRGLLPGIGLAVGLLAVAQVAVIAGGGAWFPPAAAALWAISPSSVPAAVLLGVVLWSLVGVVGTWRSWSGLELDR